MMKIICTAAMFTGLAFAQPSVFSDGVLNAASFVTGQPVAPGAEVAIFGSNLASALLPSSTVPLSSNIGGTSVSFNGIPAGLYFVSSGQINAQLPWEIGPGAATMVVTSPAGTSAQFQVQVTAAAPGVYCSCNASGAGYAIAVNSDGTLAAPASVINGAHPATAGEMLVIYASGLGAVTPTDTDGAPSLDQLRRTLGTPVVMIGGQQAQVPFSGLSPQFPGINQLNVIVPSGVSGNSVPLQILMNGITTTSQVTIAVQ